MNEGSQKNIVKSWKVMNVDVKVIQSTQCISSFFLYRNQSVDVLRYLVSELNLVKKYGQYMLGGFFLGEILVF